MTPEQIAAEALEYRSQRDRAREVAVALEQQLAAVMALHVEDGWGMCDACDLPWPCGTIRAADPERYGGGE